MAPEPPLYDIDAAVRARLPDADPDVALLHLATMRLGRVVENALDRTLRTDGVDRSEHSVMAALWFAGPPHQLSPTQLSQAVVQTTSGMTKTIRRLEVAGFVTRTSDPDDGRGRLVVLTSAGARLVARQMREFVAQWQEALAAHEPSERAKLSSTLWVVLGAIEPSAPQLAVRQTHGASTADD